MRVWQFIEGKYAPPETWRRPGKQQWPDSITLVLDRARAFRLLIELANSLSYQDEAEHLVWFAGELERDPDGEEPDR